MSNRWISSVSSFFSWTNTRWHCWSYTKKKQQDEDDNEKDRMPRDNIILRKRAVPKKVILPNDRTCHPG